MSAKHVVTMTLAGIAVAGVLLLGSGSANAIPLGTSFTYQGQVLKSGIPGSGSYNFQYKLYDAVSGGTQIGVTQTLNGVPVTNGIFKVEIDFGSTAFDGNARWLEIAAQAPGDLSFTTLSPRVLMTGTPYAIYARAAPGGGFALPFTGSGDTPGAAAFEATNSSASGGFGTTGVKGVSSSATLGQGVSGVGTYIGVNGDGGTYGTYGSGGTYGAYGTSLFGKGVYGVHGSSTGTEPGVFGTTNSTDPMAIGTFGEAVAGRGVQGNSTGSGMGVAGWSVSGWGVYGTSNGANKAGVFGQTSGTDASGVLGRQESNSGAAVFGYASAGAVGVLAVSEGNDGVSARTNSTFKSAVFGYTEQPTSYGGYFFNNSAGGVSLHAEGIAEVKVLKILGGADLAERFDGDAGVEPGTVMMIDGDRTGRVVVSSGAYCHRVAGVVSGAGDLNAGITLGNTPEDHESVPLAMTGRVWVKADASQSPIHAGDLLTTADRAGHAMAATDRARSQGAILGKAMSSLDRGTGLVLVLVSLQ